MARSLCLSMQAPAASLLILHRAKGVRCRNSAKFFAKSARCAAELATAPLVARLPLARSRRRAARSRPSSSARRMARGGGVAHSRARAFSPSASRRQTRGQQTLKTPEDQGFALRARLARSELRAHAKRERATRTREKVGWGGGGKVERRCRRLCSFVSSDDERERAARCNTTAR